MRTILCTILATICSISLMAQSGTLQGTLRDADSGEPLIGANLRLGEEGTTTDFDGYYQFVAAAGTYQLEVSYVGYEKYTTEVTLRGEVAIQLDISLNESATMLNTATVTSGKFEKPLGEVTVSLEVISPDLIESNNTPSVEFVLEKIPGVSMVGGQANIRGGSGFSYGAGSRVLLLVDDIPILQADAGFPQWEDVPIESVEQIEVVKGAASALYGSSALNGIINIRTSYAKSDPEGKLSMFHTSFFSPKDEDKKWWGDRAPFESGVSGSFKKKFNRFDLVFGGFAINRRSFNQSTRASYQRFNFNTRYRATETLSFGVNGNGNMGNSSSFFFWRDGESGAHQGDPRTYNVSERRRFNIDPFLTWYDPSGNRHKLLGRYYRVNNEVSDNQSNMSSVIYGEYQFQRNFEGIEMILTSGLVAYGTQVEAPLYGDTSYTSRNLAYYLQVDKKFFDRLNLSAGFRYEQNRLNNPGFSYQTIFDEVVIEPSEELEAKPVFRLGANYRVLDFTYLRASWGQGYRYPTIAEKYILTTFGGTPITPNPDLESETGWSTEIGLKQGFRLGGFDGFLDVAAFWTEYQNMMEFTFVDLVATGFQSRNVGGTIIKGAEVSVAGQGDLFGMPTTILTGYTYIDPKFQNFDNSVPTGGEEPTEGQLNAANSSVDYNILKYRTKHTFKLDLESRVNDFSFGIAAFYGSHMEAIDAIFEGLIVPGLLNYRTENNQGYKVVNLRAAYHFSDRSRVSLLVNNLLNEEYSVRPGLLEAPRSLGLRLDFGF